MCLWKTTSAVPSVHPDTNAYSLNPKIPTKLGSKFLPLLARVCVWNERPFSTPHEHVNPPYSKAVSDKTSLDSSILGLTSVTSLYAEIDAIIWEWRLQGELLTSETPLHLPFFWRKNWL